MRTSGTAVLMMTVIGGSIGGCDFLPGPWTSRIPTPQYDPIPIPTAPDSPTRAEDFAKIAEWERRNMLEAYDRVGRRDPRWDEAARKFISQHSLVRLWNAEELAPEGLRILWLGCNDPLVQYLVGLDLWWTDIESMEATLLFEQALEGMKQVPYPRGIARFVVSGLFRDHARTRKGWAQRPLVPLELQWFREAMTDGSYQAGDEVVLAYHLRFGTGRSMLDRNQEAVYLAVEENPHLDRWVKLLISARRHFYNAWAARGSGYAHEVTEEGWRVFRQELALERKDLAEAWRLRPDRPEIAEAMMYLVHLQDFEGETVRMWFDRTVALQMDYTAAYWTMLTDLEPRWHGSHEEMLRFARECVETERYDTPVPQILFDALERIESDEHESGHPGDSVYQRPEVFPLVQRVVDGYLGVVQEKRRRREYNTRFVLAAHKAGRSQEACERILAMDGGLDAELTKRDPGGPRLLAGRICAHASAGGRLETAETLFQEGEREAPLDIFEQAASEESRTLAQAYLRHRIAALELEGELAKGDWVSFLPTRADLAGWEVMRGQWELEGRGSVLGKSASKGMMLRSAARVGPNVELKGEYELVRSSNDWYQVGIVVGYPRAHGKSWFSFRMLRNPSMGEVASLGTGFYAPHVQVEAPVPMKGRFHLVCQDGRVSAEVNGAIVGKDYESPDGLATLPDALVGFAGIQDGNIFWVRYRNVRLRRLGS